MVNNDNSICKNLPEDLICTEIFSRLPTKSVGRFRCLSKTWRTRLTSSDFISLHLTRKPHQEHPIISLIDDSLHLVTCLKSTHAASSQKILLQINRLSVLGSCNGLILVKGSECNLYLVNPITMQQLQVPASTFSWDTNYIWNRSYGFGYDSSTHDYKIVILTATTTVRPNMSVEVYSFKRSVWKRLLVDSNTYYHHSYVESLCFVNGAMHWESTNLQSKSIVTVAYNLANEVLHEIPMPTKSNSYRLLILRGFLSAIVYIKNSSTGFEIWMMREYGVVDSWTKFIISTHIPMRNVIPSFLNSDDEFVLGNICDDEFGLGNNQTTLIMCNMKERSTRNIIVDGLPKYMYPHMLSFMEGYSFVDSLVSPNQLTG